MDRHGLNPRETEADLWVIGLLPNLLAAFYWLETGIRNGLAIRGRESLSRPQLLVLAALPPDGLHGAAVARRLSISRQAVSQTTRELVALGLVLLRPVRWSRNARLVTPTEAGLAWQAAFAEAQAKVLDELRRRGSDPDRLMTLLFQSWGPPVRAERLAGPGPARRNRPRQGASPQIAS